MSTGGRRKKVARVVRGGSWNNNARNLRAANRNANEPGNANDNLGFRLCRAQAGKFPFDPVALRSPALGRTAEGGAYE